MEKNLRQGALPAWRHPSKQKEVNTMKVLLLTGSAHRMGTTHLLADEFERGAREAGCEVARGDAAFLKVGGCLGCNHCKSHGGECVQRDDFDGIRAQLLEAEVVAFAAPLYYFGMPSQLKAVVDRFHAFSSELKRGNRRICLLAVCADQKPEGMEALKIHFERIASYLGWEDGGSVLALGCFDRADLEKTDYPRQAWELGRGLLRGDRG